MNSKQQSTLGGRRKPSLKLSLGTVNETSKDQKVEGSENVMKSLNINGGLDSTVPVSRTPIPRSAKTPRIIDEGVEKFKQFDWSINQLDLELLHFANNARPLGSSVSLIRSSYALRRSLHQIRHLFRVNASSIYPSIVENERPASLEPIILGKRSRAMRDPLNLVKVPNRMIEDDDVLTSSLEELPEQFGRLGEDMLSFLRFLHDIPEFTDENLTHSMQTAHADIMYWEQCLSDHQGNFITPAVQRYVNNLSDEIGEHARTIKKALDLFQKNGINYIRSAQTQAQTGFQNLSTVATFFSAMTATTLQFAWDKEGALFAVVNGLWIASLVFSVASAIHSQLVYQCGYRHISRTS
ncbi:hypothetical protein FRC02_010530 [Tulasnella sp. 418]|nr:hypothetical protein FRC02_010530 [Tulasnella sp. 418]